MSVNGGCGRRKKQSRGSRLEYGIIRYLLKGNAVYPECSGNDRIRHAHIGRLSVHSDGFRSDLARTLQHCWNGSGSVEDLRKYQRHDAPSRGAGRACTRSNKNARRSGRVCVGKESCELQLSSALTPSNSWRTVPRIRQGVMKG